MPDGIAHADIHLRLIEEQALDDGLRASIRRLLVAAYPQFADFWRDHDFWGGPAEARLLLMHDGVPVAHLGFGRRAIGVGDHDIVVAGVGAVATHPDWQGHGLGRRLFGHLRDALRGEWPAPYGFLQCRPAVVPFYEKAGLVRLAQSVRSLDPDERHWTTDHGPAMLLPAMASIEHWPGGGQCDRVIDLRGMPW